MVYNANGGLNVRNKASLNSKIINVIPDGTLVKVYKKENKFSKVKSVISGGASRNETVKLGLNKGIKLTTKKSIEAKETIKYCDICFNISEIINSDFLERSLPLVYGTIQYEQN